MVNQKVFDDVKKFILDDVKKGNLIPNKSLNVRDFKNIRLINLHEKGYLVCDFGNKYEVFVIKSNNLLSAIDSRDVEKAIHTCISKGGKPIALIHTHPMSTVIPSQCDLMSFYDLKERYGIEMFCIARPRDEKTVRYLCFKNPPIKCLGKDCYTRCYIPRTSEHVFNSIGNKCDRDFCMINIVGLELPIVSDKFANEIEHRYVKYVEDFIKRYNLRDVKVILFDR